MAAPTRRFSLAKILPTQGKPAPTTDPVIREMPRAAVVTPPMPATKPTERQGSLPASPDPVKQPETKPTASAVADKPRRALKRKRSYSVDPQVVADFEALAWSQEMSSSEIVEKLMRQHLADHAKGLEKAKLMKPVAVSA